MLSAHGATMFIFVLWPQKWLENVPYHTKIYQVFAPQNGIFFVVVAKVAVNVPISCLMSGIVTTNTAGKCPSVSLKTSSGVTRWNTAVMPSSIPSTCQHKSPAGHDMYKSEPIHGLQNCKKNKMATFYLATLLKSQCKEEITLPHTWCSCLSVI